MPPNERSLRALQQGFVIPAGTQVVLTASIYPEGDQRYKPAGSVGIVIEVPQHHEGAYVVRFADGKTVQASRNLLAVRRREIDELLNRPDEDFIPHVIYRCRVGSHAFGLAGEKSDDDLRGIFLPPAQRHWSLYRLPEQVERNEGGIDEVYWELEKFLRLALKANPNILETLWTPLVLDADAIARELRALRHVFLSRHVYKTYSGYVLSQFRRMAAAFRASGQFKTKHAMHLIRLLHSGISALETGEILIDVSPWREKLLAIKRGEWSFAEVEREALRLETLFQSAYEATALPEQPDVGAINDFLIRARRSRSHE
jgi:predicted nucleotidyltransferase